MTTFTRTWDASYEASPADSQNASQGATRIREIKEDVSERLEVDHSWAGDADDGAHKKLTLVEQASDPTAVTNRMFVYTKEGTDGKSELFVRNEDGDIIQITSNGSFGMVGEVKCFAFSSAPTGWLECDGSPISRTTYADLFAKIGTTFGSGDGATTFNIPDLRGEFIRGWSNSSSASTTTVNAESAGATVIEVNDTTDFLARDYVAITLSDGTKHESIIDSVSAGTSITIGTAIPTGKSVSSGADVVKIRDPDRTFGTRQESQNKDHGHTASASSDGSHSHSIATSGSGGSGGVGDAATGSGLNTSTEPDHTHTITVDNSGEIEARPTNVAMLYCIKY